MNTQEACNILGVSPGATTEEVKKAFKQKAVEFHPDRNKAPDAESKFKIANEAYQFIEANGSTVLPPRQDPFAGNPFSYVNFSYTGMPESVRIKMEEQFFGNFQKQHFKPHTQITVPVEISFNISVLGGEQEIEYERTVKCDICNGSRKQQVDCPKCNGTGFIKSNSGDLQCFTCKATGKVPSSIPCKDCNGTGGKNEKTKIKFKVPPGITDGQNIALRKCGNWYDRDFFDDVFVIFNVIPEPNMTLHGIDVVSNIELSLLDALKGTKINIKTVKGDKTLSIPAKVKNGDNIKVSGFGVPNTSGSHVFLITVNYPEDIEPLTEVLEKLQKKEI